jgi:hypothetical protein
MKLRTPYTFGGKPKFRTVLDTLKTVNYILKFKIIIISVAYLFCIITENTSVLFSESNVKHLFY